MPRSCASFVTLVQFRRQQVCRADGDRFIVTQDFSDYLFADGRRSSSVNPFDIISYLFGNDLVSFTHQYVKNCLGAHYLARRCHKRRITKFLAHPCISASTASYLSSAFCSFNCDTRFESMPPGIWYLIHWCRSARYRSRMPRYFSLISSKYFFISVKG